MSVNVRPSKRIVEEKKEKEKEVKLSEKCSKLLETVEKMDAPEKLFALEDKIAVEMTHNEIYEQFKYDYQFLHEAVEHYLEGKPTTIESVARVARLRRNTRLCHYATAQMRKEVAERMEMVDAKLLQLQNVTSEVQHIQKEIDRCLDFSAGDEQLEMVSVEEFYQQAPESLANPDETIGNEHEQYLARLKFENEQRRELLSTLQELEGRRNVLQSDIRGKEVRLQGLKPKLEDLAKVSEPAFEMVGAKFKDLAIDAQQKQLSLSLPALLAVAHIHATAYKEIHDDKLFEFRIIGNGDVTKQTKDEGESKRRRKDDESTQEKVEQSAGNVFDLHPMALEFEIECSDDVKVTMTLQYLTELKVSTAKWTLNADSSPKFKKAPFFSSESLLIDLFEDDSGDQCPDKVAQMKMEHLKLDFDSKAKHTGKPYQFVQQLSGGNGIAVTEHLRTVIKAIRSRITDRIVLENLIGSLESKKLDGISVDVDVKIVSFKQCDDESFIAGAPTSVTESIAKSTSSERFPFRIELEDVNAKRLTSFISIPADYPRHIALFGIVAPDGSNAETVKEIGGLLNNESDYVDDVQSLKEQLAILVKHVNLS